MKHPRWFAILLPGWLATIASAQPAPPPEPRHDDPPAGAKPDAGSPTGAAGGSTTAPAGPAGESMLEPERIKARPARPPAEPLGGDDAMTLDRLVITSTSRIDLNFFGDVSLEQLKDQKAALAVGPLGFQVTAHLAEGLVGRTEFAMSFEDGDTVVDVERAYLEYRTEHWTLAAGRTHAELGYWNNAFHHGRWLQLTINRPHVLRFEDEGGMLQVHSVGVAATYGPGRGHSGLEIALGVGNGHGPTLDRIQTESDNNWAKSVLVRIGAVGIGHPALRFGVNVAIDSIAPEDATVRPLLPDRSIFELLTGAYVALRSESLIAFSETYNVLHRGGGQTWQVTDGFVILGVPVGRFTPFAEIEVRHGDGLTDPFYNPDPMVHSEVPPPGNFVEGIAGLRFELSAWSALKLELAASRVQLAADPSRSESDYRAELNWSFGR
jgi:hypothetical protein